MNELRPKIIFLRISLVTALCVILFLATTPRQYPVISDMNDKFNHLLAFFVLAMLAEGAFPKKKFFPIKFLSLITYGVGIEFIQYFLPYREFSLFDVTADLVGIAVYLMVRPILKKGVRRFLSGNKLNG